MSSRKLKILGILLLSPVALIFLLWFLVIKPSAEKRLNATLKQSGIPISGDPLRVFFLGLESASTLTINTRPVPVPLDQPRLKLSPLALKLHPELTLNSAVFGGRLEASLAYGISDGNVSAELKAEDLQVAKYQIASMLGFTEGKIDLLIEGKSSGAKSFTPTKLFLMLKGLKKPYASKLPQFISPIPFNIPAIYDGELVAEISCHLSECRSNKLAVSSNLGQANGSVSLSPETGDQLQASLTVSLTQAGRTELLPYFGLINQELLRNPDRPFMLKITGSSGRPKLSVVPLQNSM